MFRKKATKLFERAGITVNGDQPWDIRVNSDEVFSRALLDGNLGLGETYMDQRWQCERLDEFFYRLIKKGLDQRPSLANALAWISAWIFNKQKKSRARQIGERHYDLGNDLFQAMLDPTMSYSCGYWTSGAKSLGEAQINKLDLICRKIHLQPGEHVLDIGCGWGGFADYAATNYGARVTGLTVSKEQAKLAEKRCAGKPVIIMLEDYRKLTGQFDKIVSIGMFEHVGPKNYRTYMQVAERCLKDDGIFLLHTIGTPNNKPGTDSWMERYIFPNGVIPSMPKITDAANGIFTARDVHKFGPYYNQTLMAWWKNFNAAWPELSKNNQKYNKRFYRMWQYYLLSCAAAFRAGKLELWQIVFTKQGSKIAYAEVR